MSNFEFIRNGLGSWLAVIACSIVPTLLFYETVQYLWPKYHSNNYYFTFWPAIRDRNMKELAVLLEPDSRLFGHSKSHQLAIFMALSETAQMRGRTEMVRLILPHVKHIPFYLNLARELSDDCLQAFLDIDCCFTTRSLTLIVDCFRHPRFFKQLVPHLLRAPQSLKQSSYLHGIGCCKNKMGRYFALISCKKTILDIVLTRRDLPTLLIVALIAPLCEPMTQSCFLYDVNHLVTLTKNESFA